MGECFDVSNTVALRRQLKSLFPPGARIPDDEVLDFYIDAAVEVVLNKAFPFGGFGAEQKAAVLRKYRNITVRIAYYYVSKVGASGETAHSENGVSRRYESADVPTSMLKQITPFCKGYTG